MRQNKDLERDARFNTIASRSKACRPNPVRCDTLYVCFAPILQMRGILTGDDPMALFDDEPGKKAKPHEIGQDLSLLSVGELNERIAMLKEEIARLEAELSTKGATKSAAEALFRR